MANVNHSSLTDPYLHEPKGTAAASVGQVYVADGAGSGSYAALTDSVSVVIGFDDSTPAHQHAITTTDSVLDLPSPTTLTNTNFTVLSSPNFRIQYDGTTSRSFHMWFNCSATQSAGADRDLQWVTYKNGAELAPSRVQRTAGSGDWGSISMDYDFDLTTNDYIEIFGATGSSTATVDYASAYLRISGVPS